MEQRRVFALREDDRLLYPPARRSVWVSWQFPYLGTRSPFLDYRKRIRMMLEYVDRSLSYEES